MAALKQDAKNFDSHVMDNERKKHKTLHSIYEVAKKVLPKLEISQQNIDYYASLANYYTVYELERFEEEQRYLYLLCYAFKRYQQITDTLVDALGFHVKKLEDEIKERAKEQLANDHLKVDKQVGKLILIYVNDELSDDLTLGEVRKLAYEILPKNSIKIVGEKLVNKTKRDQELQWKERDKASRRYTHHLRPLLETIEFDSRLLNNSLLTAIQWMRQVFKKGESLAQQAFNEFPQAIISKRLRPYLITQNKEGTENIDPRRYEILVYRQIIKQIQTGALHVESSTKHKTFYHELDTFEKKEDVLKILHIPWFQKPCKEQVAELLTELNMLWVEFDDKLKKGELKHIKYDNDNKKVLCVKPKIVNEEKEERQTLYNKIPICDVADMLQFVNKETGFFSSFTPLQPRCKKQKIDEDNIIAVLISQATNIGNYKMAQTSDISYRTLETTYQQYMR